MAKNQKHSTETILNSINNSINEFNKMNLKGVHIKNLLKDSLNSAKEEIKYLENKQQNNEIKALQPQSYCGSWVEAIYRYRDRCIYIP